MNNNIIEELSLATHSESKVSYPYNCQPLQKGNTAPSFFVHRHCGITGDEFNHSFRNEALFSLTDFLDYGHPLVIFFAGIATRSLLQAKKLEALQESIQQQGGKLLILTPAAPKHIKRQLSHSSSLSVFHDCDNEIAGLFGLYNEQNPLWQWVSGIDEEETLPAFYVVSPDTTIAYRFADFDFALYRSHNFSSQPFIEDMLDAVQQTSVSIHGAELYKLVS